jgi:hypothetical protein
MLSLLGIVVSLPSPMMGFYMNPMGCQCTNTKYCKLDGDKFLFMYCGHETGDWSGTCRQIGIGEYELDLGPDYGKGTIRSYPLFIKMGNQILLRLWPTCDILFTERNAIITKMEYDENTVTLIKYDSKYNELSRTSRKKKKSD